MYVYTYHDNTGKVIYVGQAKDPYRRYIEHVQTDRWSNDIEKIIVRGPYPKSDVGFFERYYVHLEKPKYNKNLTKTGGAKVLEFSDPYPSIVFNSPDELKDYFFQSPEKLSTKTYYLRMDQIEMLDILCFETKTEKSALIRKILDEYFAQQCQNSRPGLRTEAEERLKQNYR